MTEHQRYQVDIDAPTSEERPPIPTPIRYHRMCPLCRHHQLNGLIAEHNTGEHRGSIYCCKCRKLLEGFWLWDTISCSVIAKVQHMNERWRMVTWVDKDGVVRRTWKTFPELIDDNPVEWSSGWLASVRHMTGKEA